VSARPHTYRELADAAGCTVRSVRNYLRDAPSTLGLRVRVVRGPNREMRVTAASNDGAATIDEIGRAAARDLLRRLFPLSGTTLDRRVRGLRAQVLVSTRGAYEYGEAHLRVVRAWLQAASARPRRAVEIAYEGAERGLRVVWPLGVVLRDAASVYLAGVPAEEETGSVRTYALHRVATTGRRSLRELSVEDSGVAPRCIEAASIEDAIDLPFSVFSARGGRAVHLHARFTPEQARYIEGRRWHRKQRLTKKRDGSLEIRFGPADLGETLAWVRQWGRSITVVGDAEVCRAIGRGAPAPVLKAPKR
jgi:hypothetical protein